MEKCRTRLTVFFDNPFWVGVYERISDGKLDACKVTFGAEPKDYEIYEFFNSNWNTLRFSPAVEAEIFPDKRINPKRIQREINKIVKSRGVGTKSQQALKLQQEQSKAESKMRKSLDKKRAKERQFELRQQKRKEKHKGR